MKLVVDKFAYEAAVLSRYWETAKLSKVWGGGRPKGYEEEQHRLAQLACQRAAQKD
jgi:hypothetical protein